MLELTEAFDEVDSEAAALIGWARIRRCTETLWNNEQQHAIVTNAEL